jgi:hypothetical protein
MEILNQSMSNGGAVDQSAYSGAANQKWQVSYLNNGMYQLTNVNSDRSWMLRAARLRLERRWSSGRVTAAAISST